MVRYRTTTVDGLRIFYREAGDPTKPSLVLLHGFPSSSVMFRDLILLLADRVHLIAPDYPGFGRSEAPPPARFAYTFEHLAEVMGPLPGPAEREALQPLSPRLRRPDRVSPGPRPPRTRAGAGHSERRRP